MTMDLPHITNNKQPQTPATMAHKIEKKNNKEKLKQCHEGKAVGKWKRVGQKI